MRSILAVLSVLTVFAYADSQLGQSNGRELQTLPRKLRYSSAVPFSEYGDVDTFTCEHSGYFPYAGNCRYYYQCVKFTPDHFVRYVYQCDEDRVYAVQDKSCVKAADSDRAKCRGQLGNKPTKSNHKEQDETLEDTTLLMDDEQSDESTDRRNLSAYSFETESSEDLKVPSTTDTDIGNEATGITTDSSDFVEASSETDTDDLDFSPEETYSDEYSTEEPNEANDNEQPECVEEGFFADSENCSKFYRCVSFAFRFIKYEFSCPRGTIWDDRLKTCNFRPAIRQIKCKDRNEEPLFPFVEQGIVNSVGNSKNRVTLVCPTGFRQHPSYCNAFYQCIVNQSLEYRLTVFLCPEGTIFDEKNVRCSREQSENSCMNFEFVGEQLSSRILKHSETTMCPTEGRFPYDESCTSHYLECKRNQLGALEGYFFNCPQRQVYSSIANKCVLPTLSSFCNVR